MNDDTLLEVIKRWAGEIPDAPALSDSTHTLSYRELDKHIDTTAAWLGALGVRAGDRILIIAENGVALATLILAAQRAGVTAVLENARRAGAETDAIREHCMPHAVLCVLDHSPDAARHAERLGAVTRFDAPPGAIAVRVEPTPAPHPHDPSVTPAAIIYTTGTTGKPKGVMLSATALAYIARQMRALRYVTPRDRVYGVLPITHIMGLASVLCGTLMSGAHLYLVPRFNIDDCLARLMRREITMLQGAPAMFAKIVDHCRAQGMAKLEGVRFTAAGGAPIDPTVKREAEQLFGVPLHNGYGLTEAASTCWTRFDDDNTDGTVGRPLPGVEVRIEAAGGDGAGELWVRGPHVMDGYFRAPERTAEVMKDGWFNTQDLARMADDGRVHIVGRTRDIIIRSGFNVYPLEIEHTLSMHPEVLHSAVLGRPVKGNEEIVAFVELSQNASVTSAELLAWLAEKLSPYKRPAQLIIVPSLPVAANGKVLKSSLVVPAV
jgi:acyl-CoA synthetase (AMP-forming)/AMP-acid ligase II